MTKDKLSSTASAYKYPIQLNPKHKGLFTAKAKRAGMGVQEFATHVMAHKQDYDASTVKQASFARVSNSWKK